MKLPLILTLLAAALLTTHALAADGKLETVIPSGIKLLEAKDYKAFLKAFVPPEDFEKIIGKDGMDEFAAGFGKIKGPRLLEVLKAIKDVKPEMSADGKKATFKIPGEAGGGKGSISFSKIGDGWFIED